MDKEKIDINLFSGGRVAVHIDFWDWLYKDEDTLDFKTAKKLMVGKDALRPLNLSEADIKALKSNILYVIRQFIEKEK